MSVQDRRPTVVDDVRQHIVSSLFSRTDATGTPDETLISFVKVYEDDSGADGAPTPPVNGSFGSSPSTSIKTRYLMLAVTRLGKVVVHKAKRNSNLTFSKGKTWNLEDMRVLEVIGSTGFALTMTIRRYHWQTDRQKEQTQFLNALVKVYRTYTKGQLPQLINFTPPSEHRSTPPPLTSAGSTESLSNTGYLSPTSPTEGMSQLGMDLRAPHMPKQRTGSTSSALSAQGSSYQSENGLAARGIGGNGRQQHTPRTESFSRSPLADSSIPPARTSFDRRPSSDSRRNGGSSGSGRATPIVTAATPTPTPPLTAPYGHSNGSGIGLGVPPSSRPDQRPITPPSSHTELEPERPDHLRRPSMDRIKQPSRPSSPDRPARSNRAAARLSREISDVGGSRPHTPQPSASLSERKDAVPPPIQSQLAPTITTTLPSPAMPSDDTLAPPSALPPAPAPGAGSSSGTGEGQRRIQRRASFHPPPLETAFSREVLLTGRTGLLPGAGLTVDHGEAKEDAIMASVEEMLEGFDWTAQATSGESGVKKRGADAIEGRLLDELAALDSANIHAFLESDDRIAQVLGHIDEALAELEEIDSQITGYKMQLNAVTEDISYIESQNRGLQVQTSNQQALLDELRQLLQIAEVPAEDLRILVQESPSSSRGVQALELSAASLYKALQAGMDSANAEVQATIRRLREYQESSSQFCKRLLDYLEITFKYQSDQTLSDFRKQGKAGGLKPHTTMGEYLMMYEGLVLYMKEMDEARYQQLCSNYFAAASDLHQSEMKDMLMGHMGTLKGMTGGEPNEASFVSAAAASAQNKPSALQKSKAVIGLGGQGKEAAALVRERKGDDGGLKVGEMYQAALSEIINQIITEEDYINAFLHLGDTESTFADHMELDSYFRRQAARHASGGMSKGMVQLVRSMMDLIFGFVPGELVHWVEAGVDRNPIAVVGVIGVTERLAKEAEQENTSIFFGQLFDRLLVKQHSILDNFMNEQIRVIDSAKYVVKRRRGVTFFIRHFPLFVERMEAQLEGNGDLSVRGKVDDGYERIINAIFASLTHLAKMDKGEGQAAEDKGQLNYHVIMIENMYHFVEDLRRMEIPALAVFYERARSLYEENLGSYTKLLIRRSFGRLMDFFDGVEKLLQSTPANEISLHPTYSRSTLKKILRDFSIKDMKKAVDLLSKRVDKHFNDEETGGVTGMTGGGGPGASGADPAVTAAIISAVWAELTKDLKKEVARDDKMIRDSYKEGGLDLEFGAGDVDAACKRVRQ